MSQFEQRNTRAPVTPPTELAPKRAPELHPAVASTVDDKTVDVSLRTKLPDRSNSEDSGRVINADTIRDVVQEVAGVGKGFKNQPTAASKSQRDATADPVATKLKDGRALTEPARALGTNEAAVTERAPTRDSASSADRTESKVQQGKPTTARSNEEQRIDAARAQQPRSTSQMELGNISRLRDRLTARAIELTRESASVQDRSKENQLKTELRRITSELTDLRIQHERIVELQREAVSISPAEVTRQITSMRVQQFQLGNAALMAALQTQGENPQANVKVVQPPLQSGAALERAALQQSPIQAKNGVVQPDLNAAANSLEVRSHKKQEDRFSAFEHLRVDGQFWQRQAEQEQNRIQVDRQQREQRRVSNEREYGLRYEEVETVVKQRKNREMRLGLKEWIITRYGGRGTPVRTQNVKLRPVDAIKLNQRRASQRINRIFFVLLTIALALILLDQLTN